ncbi:hypothetical protein SESBI_07280 [Sesbania bispinosa]|nr:hypothetical protein SESBI_07280 [Sesbania bispinosa]
MTIKLKPANITIKPKLVEGNMNQGKEVISRVTNQMDQVRSHREILVIQTIFMTKEGRETFSMMKQCNKGFLVMTESREIKEGSMMEEGGEIKEDSVMVECREIKADILLLRH